MYPKIATIIRALYKKMLTNSSLIYNNKLLYGKKICVLIVAILWYSKGKNEKKESEIFEQSIHVATRFNCIISVLLYGGERRWCFHSK